MNLETRVPAVVNLLVGVKWLPFARRSGEHLKTSCELAQSVSLALYGSGNQTNPSQEFESAIPRPSEVTRPPLSLPLQSR